MKLRTQRGQTRANAILVFLYNHSLEHDFSPTYEEIGEATGMSSKSHVWYYLDALIEQGMIKHSQGRLRVLSLTAAGRERAIQLCGKGDAANVTSTPQQ